MKKEKEIVEACNIAVNNIVKEGITDVGLFNRPYICTTATVVWVN